MIALEFLKTASVEAPVIALVGADRALKGRSIEHISRVVFGDEDSEADLGFARYGGKDADFATVRDELSQLSMFGETRVVLIEAADEFVTNHRSHLENYAAKPGRGSILVLDLKSFPKTTKLAKAVAKTGLIVDCAPLAEGDLANWLSGMAKAEFQKKLTRPVARLMVELTGSELGLLEQELAKVVSYVGDAETITDGDVRTVVGGWRAETTWVMVNAVRDDNLDAALSAMHRLLASGEAVQKILGGINFVFRKYAKAALVAAKQPLRQSLSEAGVFPREVQSAERYLRRIGPHKARKLLPMLLEADTNLKGGTRAAERLVLEELLVSLAR